jgi:quercetin dioxygenase-like cupin family protein
MPIVQAEQADVHALHGSTFSAYLSPSRGSSELCAWRVEIAPTTTGVAHRLGREDVFYVLDGQPRMTIDDVPSQLAAGDAVAVPAGATLRVDNDSAEPASLWVTTSVGFDAELPDGSRMAPPWVK